jgi:hypothetical protein
MVNICGAVVVSIAIIIIIIITINTIIIISSTKNNNHSPASFPLPSARGCRFLFAALPHQPSTSPPSAQKLTTGRKHSPQLADHLLHFLPQNSHRVHFFEKLQRTLLQLAATGRGVG